MAGDKVEIGVVEEIDRLGAESVAGSEKDQE
jgi:hypothetical protein